MNRSQVKKTARNTLILDAYNANPSSMQLAITHFIKQDFKSKLFILGDMLELGKFAKIEHERILMQLSTNGIKQAILVGPLFYEHKTHFPNYHFFENGTEVELYLKNHIIQDVTVLIKGSRGIKLEKLVEYL